MLALSYFIISWTPASSDATIHDGYKTKTRRIKTSGLHALSGAARYHPEILNNSPGLSIVTNSTVSTDTPLFRV